MYADVVMCMYESLCIVFLYLIYLRMYTYV